MNDSLAFGVDICLSALWRGSLQGALFIAIATVVERLWKQMPPNLRSWMWRLVFAKMILAALVSATIPLPTLPARVKTSVAHTSVETTGAVETVSAATPAAQDALPIWSLLLVAGWLTGVLVSSCLLWSKFRQIRRQLASTVHVAFYYSFALDMLTGLSRLFALPRKPELRLLLGYGSPWVVGGRRPKIVMPQSWLQSCSAEQLRLAMAHELAHLSRRDLYWNQLVALCRIVFFFHPLVAWATRRYSAAQELACDELALRRTGGSPAVLARMLLQFVEQPATNQWASAAAMVGASSGLRERIAAMSRAFFTIPSTASAVLVLTAAATLLPPYSLAEQPSASSPGDPPAKKSVIRNGGGASARASGSATGIGNGNGNGNGRGFFAGSATAEAAVSGNQPEPPKVRSSPSEQPSASESAPSSSRKNAKVKQTTTVTDDGNGEQWERTTEAQEPGRQITIVETAEEIRVVIRNTQTDKEVIATAETPEQLRKKNTTAFGLYRKYAGDKAPAGGAAANAAVGTDGEPDAGGLDVGRLGDSGLGANNAAVELLKQKLHDLKQQPDVQGTPLESLLKDMEQQVQGLD